MFKSGDMPDKIVKEKGLAQISDESQVVGIIDQVLAEHSTAVEEYRNGKKKTFGFLVGQVMRLTQGKANPKLVNKILREKLEN